MIPALEELLPRILNPDNSWRIYLLDNWKTVIGALSCRMRLEKIEGDTVFIGVYETQWMQELFMLSRVILQAINKNFPEPKVARLRFSLVRKQVKAFSQPPVLKAHLSNNKIKPVELTYEQKRALSAIPDLELREELSRFLNKCMQNR